MKKTSIAIIVFCLFILSARNVWSTEIEIVITKTYLNLPVSRKAELKTMKLLVNGTSEMEFTIRLAKDVPDYWVFIDVTAYKGKRVILILDDAAGNLSS